MSQIYLKKEGKRKERGVSPFIIGGGNDENEGGKKEKGTRLSLRIGRKKKEILARRAREEKEGPLLPCSSRGPSGRKKNTPCPRTILSKREKRRAEAIRKA